MLSKSVEVSIDNIDVLDFRCTDLIEFLPDWIYQCKLIKALDSKLF